MAITLIGIDDVGDGAGPDTGALARQLAIEIEGRGDRVLGMTRHQFLSDQRLRPARHNRGACLRVESGDPGRLAFAVEWVADRSANGAGPGICIVPGEQVPREVVQWGWAATRRVLTLNAAIDLAAALGLHLRALGGDGNGIIGAMAGVGLQAAHDQLSQLCGSSYADGRDHLHFHGFSARIAHRRRPLHSRRVERRRTS
jgi:hypothetical protein